MTRVQQVRRIQELVGGDVLRITDYGTGWPSLGTLEVDGNPVPISLFTGPVGLSLDSPVRWAAGGGGDPRRVPPEQG